MKAEHHVDLKRGLVGEYGNLYHTSPSFRAAIQTLSQMLPLWVDALADRSREADAVLAQVERNMRSLPTQNLRGLFTEGRRDE